MPILFKFKHMVFKRTDGGFQMPQPDHGLRATRQISRRPHFCLNGIGNIVKPLFINLTNFCDQFNAFSPGRCSMFRKGCFGGRHSLINISRRADRNHRCNFFRSRINHIKCFRNNWINPSPIDIELRQRHNGTFLRFKTVNVRRIKLSID